MAFLKPALYHSLFSLPSTRSFGCAACVHFGSIELESDYRDIIICTNFSNFIIALKSINSIALEHCNVKTCATQLMFRRANFIFSSFGGTWTWSGGGGGSGSADETKRQHSTIESLCRIY